LNLNPAEQTNLTKLSLSKIVNNLTKNLDDKARYYFVHTYYVRLEDSKNSMFKSEYGIEFDYKTYMLLSSPDLCTKNFDARIGIPNQCYKSRLKD
jgi:hypothetical protein